MDSIVAQQKKNAEAMEKAFEKTGIYLISRPSQEFLNAFNEWKRSNNHPDLLTSDHLDKCK